MRWTTAWFLGLGLLAIGCTGGTAGGHDAGLDARTDGWALDLLPGDPLLPGDEGRSDAAIRDGEEYDPGAAPDAGDVWPDDTGLDTGIDAWTHPCPRLPGPNDFVRKVVVALPYEAEGAPSNRFTVLDLSLEGTLTPTGTIFEMGRAFWGDIGFTPDGRVGLVEEQNGDLGVFRFEDDGSVTVVAPAFSGSFYASDVVMDPNVGDRAWVLNSQWRENGGGLYAVHLECDATPIDEGLAVPGKLARGLSFAQKDPGFALVGAVDLMDSETGDNTHLLSLSGEPSYRAGTNAFGDDFASISVVKATRDGLYVLLGDNQEFANPDLPNRVAVARIQDGSLTPRQVLTPILDPIAIVESPWGNALLVVSGYGNDAFVLSYDPLADPPFVNTGSVAWGEAGKPQLPGGAVLIERGALEGLVLMSEVRGIRTLRFAADGTVADLGLTVLGEGIENMPGAIGVQP
jgi:hypothetical protein